MDIRTVPIRCIDFLVSPAVYLGGQLLKAVRCIGVASMPMSKRALLAAGVFPIRDHYYEPLFNGRHLNADVDTPRTLPGIEWNRDKQIALLYDLAEHAAEFRAVDNGLANNSNFGPGDAEIWFAMIRHFKPRRIVEVGSGYSTRIARQALALNKREGIDTIHTCIEPYEMPWLEECGATVVRKRIEEVGRELFSSLSSSDILFIDSSHVIRPQGDVLEEILEILPTLNPGVIVHFHDIFSPRNYPKKWIVDEVRLWNEQYMLEAFLTDNSRWSIIVALNYLHHSVYRDLAAACPLLTTQGEPGSFYIQKHCVSTA